MPNEKNNWLLEKNVPFVNVYLSNGVKIDAISKMGAVDIVMGDYRVSVG